MAQLFDVKQRKYMVEYAENVANHYDLRRVGKMSDKDLVAVV